MFITVEYSNSIENCAENCASPVLWQGFF